MVKTQILDLNFEGDPTHLKYYEQAKILVRMLYMYNSTFVYANQVKLYILNHDAYVRNNQLYLVLEGYKKLLKCLNNF